MKNIVTNILGFIFWVLAIYEYFNDKSMTFIVAFVIIGGALFLFENGNLKIVLKNIISKIK